MGVDVARNPVTATNLDSTSGMFQMQFLCFVEFLPEREGERPKYVQKCPFLKVASRHVRRKNRPFLYLLQAHKIPDPFFSLIPIVCHTGDHASRLWLADI